MATRWALNNKIRNEMKIFLPVEKKNKQKMKYMRKGKLKKYEQTYRLSHLRGFESVRVKLNYSSSRPDGQLR